MGASPLRGWVLHETLEPVRGFEPRLTDWKSVVLPIYDTGKQDHHLGVILIVLGLITTALAKSKF